MSAASENCLSDFCDRCWEEWCTHACHVGDDQIVMTRDVAKMLGTGDVARVTSWLYARRVPNEKNRKGDKRFRMGHVERAIREFGQPRTGWDDEAAPVADNPKET